jgi:hypothetical protein
MLGVSRDLFDRLIAPEVRFVRLGRVRVYPVVELERWLSRNASLPMRLTDDPGSANRGFERSRMAAGVAALWANCGPVTGRTT